MRTRSLAAFMLLLAAGNVAAALTADYQLLGNLNSSIPGAPALTSIGADTTFVPGTVDGHSQPVLSFYQGSGLALSPTTAVLGNPGIYTIVALVQFQSTAGHRKYVDFKNGSVDTGLYDIDGALVFYDYTAGSATPIGTGLVDVALTRDAGGALSGYIDGVLQFTADDSVNQYGIIDANNALRFFVDDAATGGVEASSGTVVRIRVWNSALGPDEIAALEPSRVDLIFRDGNEPDVCSAGCPPTGWQYREWFQQVNLSLGCSTIHMYGIVAGDPFLFTTCAPFGLAGGGDPVIKSVTDNNGNSYATNADDCTGYQQIPQLVGWTCNNQSGQLLMSCTPDNGLGLVAQPGIVRFDVQICPSGGVGTGAVPLFIWWNGTSNPNSG